MSKVFQKTLLGIITFLGLLLGVTALSLRSGLGMSTSFICIFYAIVASFFLGAQVIGFVVSQSRYMDAIEKPKYDLLEIERREWNT